MHMIFFFQIALFNLIYFLSNIIDLPLIINEVLGDSSHISVVGFHAN